MYNGGGVTKRRCMNNLYVVDVEGDSLKATKLWCLSWHHLETETSGTVTSYSEMKEFLKGKDKQLIMHNGICWDKPTLERLLKIKIKHKMVDTLGLSWYLYPKRVKHGLEGWGEDLGVPKPEITDWENLTLEEYCHRCEEDVKINTLLWHKMVGDLKEIYRDKGNWQAPVDYTSFKLSCVALQEKSKWKLDVAGAVKLVDMFEEKISLATDNLNSVMPEVPKTVNKTRPAKPYKNDGELSASGIKWKDLTDERGLSFDYEGEVKVVQKMLPPNAGSPVQIKDWLFSLGWVPLNFDFKRNKETGDVRKIPQIKDKDGELCENILKLVESIPELKYLVDLGILSHRKALVSGFLKSAEENDGYIIAGVQGFTNTLRFKHKTAVNIPSLRKPYGKEIRGLLIAASEEYELLGSDKSSLEDRTKQHYMWPHDPEYVKSMLAKDFDPHCDIAEVAGLMTSSEVKAYKWMDQRDLKEVVGKDGTKYVKSVLADKRYAGKSANYSSTYGAGADTIARAAGVPRRVGKSLHKAYWERNWSLKAIADECITTEAIGLKWLWNPIANMWYYLKKDKDKFSTLNQGTGTYCFDMWIKEILKTRKQLTAQFHDEIILEIKKGHRKAAEKLLRDAISVVNKELKLNRELGIDIDFGDNYAQIH